jgi:hypothetical protein
MEAALLERAKELLARGSQLAGTISRYEGSADYWFGENSAPSARSWFDSVFNLFRLITTPDMHYYQQIIEVSQHNNLKTGAPFWAVQQLCGSLNSIIEEIELGLVSKAEYIFTATTFDEFLDHADHFHKGGKKIEASVLASTVFEDTLRKIGTKYGVEVNNLSIEELIDSLVKVGAWNVVKAKRVKANAAVRNKALHAQWDEFEIRDVGILINDVRDLIDNYLL